MRKYISYIFLLISILIAYVIVITIYINETNNIKINYDNDYQIYTIYLKGEVVTEGEYSALKGTKLKDFIYDLITPYADLDSFNPDEEIVNHKSYEILYIDKININTADLKLLQTLNNIGNVRAQKIIEGRPYTKISDLLNKGIVGSDLYESLENHIMV